MRAGPLDTGIGSDWLSAIRRYLVAAALAHLAWEIVQLPLYTLWRTGTSGELAFAVAHCTAGDVLIAGALLLTALALLGRAEWPRRRFGGVALATIAGGLGYTIYSEYLNTIVRRSWAYSDVMPVVPGLGTGLSPLLQWIVVPAVALVAARARVSPTR
jgi:hypothetical protein